MTTTKTDNIRILHAIGGHLFRPFDPERSQLEEAYTYQSAVTDLEQIFRWNNTVDGDEREVNTSKQRRSLSVGDVVGLRTFDGGWEYHAVAPMGYEPLSSTVVDQALEKGKNYDPFVGL